jgi:Alkylmercury lyase
MPLVIKTAAELADTDVEARASVRRAARETNVLRTVLRLFADSGGPVNVEVVVTALPEVQPQAVRQKLGRLSDEDLLILRGDSIELAYPFSASPTPFVVHRADGRELFTCCALDALGIAPMLNESVRVVSVCHHCNTPLRFSVTPDGPALDARDIMVWVTRLAQDGGRACIVL